MDVKVSASISSGEKEMSELFAHSIEGPQSEWETMAEHEERVAELCRKLLHRIHPDLEPWGEVLGRWHDLGKYSNEFQAYLRQTQQRNEQHTTTTNACDDVHQVEIRGRVDHSTAAAQWACQRFDKLGRMMAYAFAGHHAGLPDWDDGESQSGLKQRLKKSIHDWNINAPDKLKHLSEPPMPAFTSLGNRSLAPDDSERQTFRIAFWIRMLFSCLVDADFLATESFMSPDRSSQRPGQDTTMNHLAAHLTSHVDDVAAAADHSRVNRSRRYVREACRNKAMLEPGFFSLNVPTGGGKTLASLEFALLHAVANDVDRVIIAVPFTSIIEQNAQVFRDVFESLGTEIVLEHHSNLDPDNETTINRLQGENWDAPLVVTTNVQLFESLFATRTSRCRKLHRIAHSVIILDEAQTLPVDLLKPTLIVLKELVEAYGCTVLLCTATQPALNHRQDFPIGLEEIRPIIEHPARLHATLKRTNVRMESTLKNERLATQLKDHDQVLCIVNTRPDAAAIYDLLNPLETDFHLSTRMCAAHRQYKFTEIRERLARGQTCRVVSTQLIEAGVDIDFPVVYRAICGLDSLTQAAGRCNREGKLAQGEVVFFEPERQPPPGFLRQSAQTARELIPDHVDDLLSPVAIEAYFRMHYWQKNDAWDNHRVLSAFGKNASDLQFNFRQADRRYQFIQDASESLIVAWGDEGKKLVRQLDYSVVYGRRFWRKLQRYSVQLRQYELSQLTSVGAAEKKHERWVLTQMHLYDNDVGLRLTEADGVLPVEDLMA